MVKNLAFERFKKGSNESMLGIDLIWKQIKDIKTDESDYMIDSKPIDEYIDDITTVIDLALEEERLSPYMELHGFAVLLTVAVTLSYY